MEENQTRKTRTGNYITYRRIIIVDPINLRGDIRVELSCGHITFLRDCGRDRIKLAMFQLDPKNTLLGCYRCGILNKEKKK